MWIRRLASAALATLATLGVAAPFIPPGYAQSAAPPQFAFSVTPVTFMNGDVTLSGGLVMPAEKGAFPAVVIVHGAGPATFDEPAFRMHANAFVRAGFAVLLFDKRGSGKSTGNLDTADYDDLAADVSAGVSFLRARADIVPHKIGLLGRSEGGWIGTLTAGRDSAIAFVIMSSGSAVAPYDQTLWYSQNALRAHGATADEIKQGVAAKAALWSYYRDVAKDPAWARSAPGLAERETVEKRLKSFARFVPEIPQRVANPLEISPAFFQAFTRKIYFEPAPAFHALKVPLLEIIGDKDDVVEPAGTVSELERLRSLGLNVTIRILPNVDHSLIVKTDSGPRYPEDYPEFAVRWARVQIEQVGLRRRRSRIGEHMWEQMGSDRGIPRFADGNAETSRHPRQVSILSIEP